VRRARLLVGVGMVAVAGVGLTALAADAGRRDEVIALRRDVAAGAALTRDDLMRVELAADSAVFTVGGESLHEFVGQHARYRLAAGAILTPGAVQPDPLVPEGHVLMSVPVSLGELPAGLSAGDEVLVVVTPALLDPACPAGEPSVVAAVVAVTPAVAAAPTARARAESASLSLDVPAADVLTIATGALFTVALPNTQPLRAPPRDAGVDCLAGAPASPTVDDQSAPASPTVDGQGAPTLSSDPIEIAVDD
jgi:hypothetical protein